MHRSPKYVQIYNQMLQMIKNSQFPAGAKLPSEEVLTAEFGVSRVTLRTALSLLKEDGVIKSIHGQGHFVLPSNSDEKSGIERLKTPIYDSLTMPIDARETYCHLNPASEFTDQLFGTTQVPYYTLKIWYQSAGQNVANEFTIMMPETIERLGVDVDDHDNVVATLEHTLYEKAANAELVITVSERQPSTFKRTFGAKGELMLMTEDVFALTGEQLAQNKFYIPEAYFRTSLMRYPNDLQNRGADYSTK